MKRIALLVLLFCLVFPTTVSAHGSGLVPFFKINGKIPDTHPLTKENIIPATFTVPQDLSTDTYLVRQPITFKIDTSLLAQGYTKDVIDTLHYRWIFGDGTKAVGLENTHTYNKIGSYTVEIYADFSDDSVEPQLIESVQLNILPDKNYKIPQPIIIVNRQDGDKIAMHNPVRFEVVFHTKPSATIASYVWEFGDGKTGKNEMEIHTYDGEQYLAAPVVRVVDANGFVGDSYKIITNDKTAGGYVFATPTAGVFILGLQAIALIGGGVYFFVVMKKHKKKKH
jgi:hypothetical protein